eukprot:ctg_747.g404
MLASRYRTCWRIGCDTASPVHPAATTADRYHRHAEHAAAVATAQSVRGRRHDGDAQVLRDLSAVSAAAMFALLHLQQLRGAVRPPLPVGEQLRRPTQLSHFLPIRCVVLPAVLVCVCLDHSVFRVYIADEGGQGHLQQHHGRLCQRAVKRAHGGQPDHRDHRLFRRGLHRRALRVPHDAHLDQQDHRRVVQVHVWWRAESIPAQRRSQLAAGGMFAETAQQGEGGRHAGRQDQRHDPGGLARSGGGC